MARSRDSSSASTAELRVEFQLVKVLADQLQAEAVERADVGRLEERQLLRPAGIVGGLAQFLFQPGADALAHFRRRCLGEGHHEDFIQRRGGAFLQQAVQAPLHQRAGLAGAGAGDNKHVASRGNGSLLNGGQTHRTRLKMGEPEPPRNV